MHALCFLTLGVCLWWEEGGAVVLGLSRCQLVRVKYTPMVVSMCVFCRPRWGLH